MKRNSIKLWWTVLAIILILSISFALTGCNKTEPSESADTTLTYIMTGDDVVSSLVLNETKSTYTITTGKAVLSGNYVASVKGYANLYYTQFVDGLAQNLYTTVKFTIVDGANVYSVVATGNANDDYGLRTVIDQSGNTVTVEGEVTKIINLWPAGTGSFYALGAAGLLIGTATNSVNDWTSFFYEDAASIPVITGGTNPNVEYIAGLEPDLVIVHPSNAATLQPQLAAVGVTSININFSDYESMKASYTMLATILGGVYKTKLIQWCEEVDEDLEYVRGLTANLTDADKPVVYYISGQSYTSDSALLTTTFSGGGTTNIMKDWCESAGGQWGSSVMNLTTGTTAVAETVFALNPDIIICGGTYQHVAVARLSTVDGWKDLTAVTGGKVYTDPYVCFNWDRFGVESLMQIKYALTVIHPELAGDINMLQEVKDFYSKYTGVTLTDTQAQYILDGKTPTGTLLAADKI